LDHHMTTSRLRSNSIAVKPSSSSSSSSSSSTDVFLNADFAQSLCTFLKDSLASIAPTSTYATACYFQLFRILHDSVNSVNALVDDKRFSKDIQDVTHKLFELCNSIVASSLQQTTWLRKNYAVKLSITSTATTSNSIASSASTTTTTTNNNSNSMTPSVSSTFSNQSGSISSSGGGGASISNNNTSSGWYWFELELVVDINGDNRDNSYGTHTNIINNRVDNNVNVSVIEWW
jgi:hypothetical protein